MQIKESIDFKPETIILSCKYLLDYFKLDKHIYQLFDENFDADEERREEILTELNQAVLNYLHYRNTYNMTILLKKIIALKLGDLPESLKNLFADFIKCDQIFLSLGKRDHLLHILMTLLLISYFNELNVIKFPYPRLEDEDIKKLGDPYPKGEIFGKEFPKNFYGFFDRLENKKYEKDQIRNFVVESNKYFFDWALSLASLFHDIAFPFCKICGEIKDKSIEILANYKCFFQNGKIEEIKKSLTFDKSKLIPNRFFDSDEFKKFKEILKNFYFHEPDKNYFKHHENKIQEEMVHLDHGLWSGYFLSLHLEELKKSGFYEREEFIETVKNRGINQIEFTESLIRYYLEGCVHAISLHNCHGVFINWYNNPIAFLLRLADVIQTFGRPELIEYDVPAEKVEMIQFGIREKGEKTILKFVLNYEALDPESLNKVKEIYKTDLRNNINNLEKPDWLDIDLKIYGCKGQLYS